MYRVVAFLLVGVLAVCAQVNVTVNWTSVKYAINPQSFGLNGFQATDPANATNATYSGNMAYMLGSRSGGGMVRIHTWEMLGTGVHGWLNSDSTWNATKIKQAVKGLRDAGMTLCINIPDGSQASNRIGNPTGFGSFCADLVRIINVDGGYGVKYWEIPNEANTSLSGVQQAAVFNAAAAAMKAVDETIKVGGPATSRPDQQSEVQAFVDATLSNLDFLSFHTYAGGGGMTDEAVWNAAGCEWYCLYMSSYLAQKSPNRHIPVWYDEFNVGWSWDLAQAQQQGICGAIYDALTLTKASDAGADVMTAWNEMDGSYGKMDNNYALRPAAHVYHIFNSFVYGDRVTTTTAKDSVIVPYASVNPGDGRHSCVLTNRTKTQRTVTIASSGWTPPATMSAYQLTPSGYAQIANIASSQLTSGIMLPAQSVTVLTCLSATSVSLRTGLRLEQLAGLRIRDGVVVAPQAMRGVSLYSVDGKVIMEHSFTMEARSFTLPHLSPGLYLVVGHLSSGVDVTAKHCPEARVVQ